MPHRRHVTDLVTPRVIGHPGEAVSFPPSWTEEALCAEANPEAWYPEQGKGTANPAKAICARCSVAVACLDYALANGEQWGIWGGLNERERRALRKAAS